MPTMASERHTAAYFEGHAHDYDPRRLTTAAAWVAEMAGDNDSLFDIGCGTGQVVVAMQQAGIRRLAGCDLAQAALDTAEGRVEFTAHQGSVLDDEFVSGLAGGFSWVTMSAVLHHVVGRTRRRSRALARHAVRNALSLLEPGGHLVIVEPAFEPRWAMTAVFWVKRLLAPFGRRVELGRWNNLGAPVVSYYGPGEMAELVAASGGTVARREDTPTTLKRLPRTLGVRGRWMTTLLVQAATVD
jgi:SAM-dependent methyltransferase